MQLAHKRKTKFLEDEIKRKKNKRDIVERSGVKSKKKEMEKAKRRKCRETFLNHLMKI